MDIEKLKEAHPDKEWKWIPGYEEVYAASNMGDVYKMPHVNLKSNGKTENRKGFFVDANFINGALMVNLHKSGRGQRSYRLGVLIAKTFIPNPSKFRYTTHLNGNIYDVTASNLQWSWGYYGTPEDRFWKSVCKTDTCWNWTGHKNKCGYGKITIDNTPALTHRYSYELHKGEIPAGLMICHACDNPSCVNPEHLYAGTHQDNARDMVVRNRVCRTGASKKITDQQVEEIRLSLRNQYQVAKEMGVSRSTIAAIRSFRIRPNLIADRLHSLNGISC